MGGLSDIPVVTVEDEPSDEGPTAAVQALLMELAEGLESLQESGEESIIDLRSLPMQVSEHEQLKALLGVGEVRVEIDSLGPTSIHETAYPGVWWVIHRNRDEEIMTQQVEVTQCPAIIRSQPDDIREGAGRLRDDLARLTETGDSA